MFTGGFWIWQLIVDVIVIGAFLCAFASDKVAGWFVKRVVDIEQMYYSEKERRKPDGYFTGDEDL